MSDNHRSTREMFSGVARRAMWAVLATSVATGCAGEPDSSDFNATAKKRTPEQTCAAAAAHLAECLGTEASQTTTCNQGEAKRVLASTCDDLEERLDSGFLSDTACELGFYHHCDTPICDPEADEPEHELDSTIPEGASECAKAALAYEGCGACEYYTCREEEAQCGVDGYLLHFANRYCERYRLVSEPEASPEAQAWLRRVRRCLILALDEKDQSNNCESIEQNGFDSHPSCYVQTGFCDLSPADWLLVFNTIDHDDADFQQMLTTGNQCLAEWLGL